MENVINFEKRKIKNTLSQYTSDREDLQRGEILLSVMKFVCLHSETVERPLEEVTPDASLAVLLGENPSRFAAVFVDLVNYWDIGPLKMEEIPYGREFEEFELVEDLCFFLEGKRAA